MIEWQKGGSPKEGRFLGPCRSAARYAAATASPGTW
jgi:hypothetical protein